MVRSDRLPEIDIARGMALLGILVVNVAAFDNSTLGAAGSTGAGLKSATAVLDRAADFVVQWLAAGKFILVFSFLLGWGIHTQAVRDGPFRPRYLRRLLGLLLIGLIHGALFFSGDILIVYAFLGLFMLRPVRLDWSVNKLVRSAIILWAVQAVFVVLAIAALVWFVPDPADEATPDDMFAWVRERYQTGNFLGAAQARLFELAIMVPASIAITGPSVVAMFRLGFAAAKICSATGIDAARPLARRLLRYLLAPVLLMSAGLAWFGVSGPEAWRFPLQMINNTVLAPFLSVAYLATLVVVLTPERRARLIPTLGAAGRMSLSGYVGQSVIMSLLFCGYGLGLSGRLGSAATLGLSMVVYCTVLGLSAIWATKFGLGPLEWLLRSFTTWSWIERGPRHAIE